jgi:hypothetical protein
MGLIKAGATPDLVGEVKSWTKDVTADVEDSSIMGNCDKRQTVKGILTTLNMSCYYDATDAGQILLAVGDEVDLELYPLGDGSSLKYFAGTALITSSNMSSEVNGLIGFDVAASIQGAMPELTVA